MIINFDQTQLSYINVGNTTLEFTGAQITGTFSITATGNFLCMQFIYAGKTQGCHPKGIPFPDGFDVTRSKNHWRTETLTIQHR